MLIGLIVGPTLIRLVPLLFLVAYAWFLAQIYFNSPLESRIGIGLMALGVPVFFAYRKFSSPPTADDKSKVA